MDFSGFGGLLGGVGAGLLGGISTFAAGKARDKATMMNDAIIAANRKRQDELLAQQRADAQALQDKAVADMQAQAAQSQADFDNLALMQLLATNGLVQPTVANPLARRKRPTQMTGPAGDLSKINTGRTLLGN